MSSNSSLGIEMEGNLTVKPASEGKIIKEFTDRTETTEIFFDSYFFPFYRGESWFNEQQLLAL